MSQGTVTADWVGGGVLDDTPEANHLPVDLSLVGTLVQFGSCLTGAFCQRGKCPDVAAINPQYKDSEDKVPVRGTVINHHVSWKCDGISYDGDVSPDGRCITGLISRGRGKRRLVGRFRLARQDRRADGPDCQEPVSQIQPQRVASEAMADALAMAI